MPQWRARIKGTLHFTRTINVYAADEKAAEEVARELTELSTNDGDSIDIHDIMVGKPTDEFDIVLRGR